MYPGAFIQRTRRMIFRIIFLTGSIKGNRVSIEKMPMIIGRAPDCHLVIDDGEVALHHATIQHTPNNELVIKDLGSMNKVLVNNHEAREVKLKHGDIVEIGRTRFLVQASVQAEVQRPPFFQPEKRNISRIAAALVLIILVAIAYDRCGKRSPKNPAADTAGAAASANTPTEAFRDMPAIEDAKQDKTIEPVTKELRAGREDIRQIRQTIEEVASKPPAATKASTSAGAGTAAGPPSDAEKTKQAAAKNLPKIRISALEQQKFPESEDFDEMRMVTITLANSEPSPSERRKIEVKASFFDRNGSNGGIEASRAIVSLKPIPAQKIGRERQETVTTAYTVPKGLRKALAESGGNSVFHGFIVEVYCDGELVDRDARPKTLLETMSANARDQQ